MSRYEEGDPNSPILLIGEAPAKEEVRFDRPFVGQAGEVLDQCLHGAGIIRRDCYILNLFHDPLPFGKKGDDYLDKSGRLLPEVRPFVEQLKEKIDKSKANVIVPMGNPALSAMMNHARITKWRGSPLSSKLCPGRKIIPTLHPAATLPGRGDYVDRYLIISDLRKANRHSKYPELPTPNYQIIINPSFNDVITYLHDCLKAERIGYDIETSRKQISCAGLAISEKLCMSIPFRGLNGYHRWNFDEEIQIWELLAEVLERVPIILGQNLMFDIPFTWLKHRIRLWRSTLNGWKPKKIQDTMIGHHIVYPDFKKGLDMLVSLHTDEPYYKDDGKIWKKEGATEQEILNFWLYNGKDAILLYPIWDNAVEKELTKGEYWHDYDETIDIFEPLIYMTTRGMRVDHTALQTANKRIAELITETQKQLDEAVEPHFYQKAVVKYLNPQSPKHCMTYFYGHKQIKPYLNLKTRLRPTTEKPFQGVTTDDKAMQRIFKKTNLREAKLVQEIRGLQKLYGTYLEVTLDWDGRLRCSWNPRGTTTGRLSSSQTVFETGLNMQNLIPEFKDFLVPDED